jgi:Fe-S oxidoreductase
VKETNPEFAKWTAKERVEEARSTEAEAIVTACPGCEQSFSDTVRENGISLKVYDVVELLKRAI